MFKVCITARTAIFASDSEYKGLIRRFNSKLDDDETISASAADDVQIQDLDNIDILVAIIDHLCIEADDSEGEPRNSPYFDNPNNHLRRLLEVSLEKNIQIIVIRLRETSSLTEDNLRPELHPLVHVDHIYIASFDIPEIYEQLLLQKVKEACEKIKLRVEPEPPPAPSFLNRKWTSAELGCFATIVVALLSGCFGVITVAAQVVLPVVVGIIVATDTPTPTQILSTTVIAQNATATATPITVLLSPTETPLPSPTATETLVILPTPVTPPTAAHTAIVVTIPPPITETPTPTATPTHTASHTATWTPSATATLTHTATWTPSATWTLTPTPTHTATWTITPSSTPTDTLTPSPSPTLTPLPPSPPEPTSTEPFGIGGAIRMPLFIKVQTGEGEIQISNLVKFGDYAVCNLAQPTGCGDPGINVQDLRIAEDIAFTVPWEEARDYCRFIGAELASGAQLDAFYITHSIGILQEWREWINNVERTIYELDGSRSVSAEAAGLPDVAFRCVR